VSSEQPVIERHAEPSAESQAALLFRYGPDEQFAVPLATIRRIETVRMNRIERVGEQELSR
jgi:two-component system chemotaxis sensor kinase CheA